MKIFTAIEHLIRSKDDQYGNLSLLPAHHILGWLDPKFRAASAVKHLIAYMRTGKVGELVKAGAYVALEYEERTTEGR